MKKRIFAFLLAASLLLPSCGGGAKATTMHLKRIEGTVGVSDDGGKSLEPAENLGLYSGYGVDTRTESYAWVDLDEVKLTKLDQNTEIEIKKEDKHLTIEVKSGALFFNVTEPLAEDETLDIRSSSMVVGIRGTCGWVEVSKDESAMRLYLLEGRVEVTAGKSTAAVNAGEMAIMTAAGEVSVARFSVQDIPAFVELEILDNDEIENTLAQLVQQENGPESEPEHGPDSQMTPEVEAALAQYRTILSQHESYDYNSGISLSNEYRYNYALVQMQTQYAVPALLLEEEPKDNGMYFSPSGILVFQYDPGAGTVSQVPGHLSRGDRNSFEMAGDGNGILILSYVPGTLNGGAGTTVRMSLSGGELVQELLWEGDNTNPDWTLEEIGHLPMAWYNVEDGGGLDLWTPYTE